MWKVSFYLVPLSKDFMPKVRRNETTAYWEVIDTPKVGRSTAVIICILLNWSSLDKIVILYYFGDFAALLVYMFDVGESMLLCHLASSTEAKPVYTFFIRNSL